MNKITEKFRTQRLSAVLFLLFAMTALALGCGTTPLVLKSADPRTDFSQYKALAVQATSQGIFVPGTAQARIKDLIKTEVLDCCPQRFASVTLDSAEPHDLLLHVRLTVYEEGNRFARFMLAGLGSMQIHAQVEMTDPKSGDLLTAGEAGKTFAWGGVYGAATGIEDLEKDFAKEVVKGLRETLRLDGAPTLPVQQDQKSQTTEGS